MLEPVVFKLKNGNRLLYNFKKRSLLNLNQYFGNFLPKN